MLEGGFADRNAAQVYRLSLRALWFFFPFGIPFVAFGMLPPQFSWTGSLVIGLYALTTLASELRARSPVGPFLAFALLSAALFAVEYIGVTTGVPFGTYAYTGVLGGLVAGVPVAMALAWYVTVVSTWRIAQRLADGPAGRNAVRVALLSGALTVILDVALEPMAAMITRYWVWEGDRVPTANYVAWFAFSFAATWLLEKSSGRPQEHPGLYLNGLMVYLMQWVLFALADTVGGQVKPAVVSAAGLLALALLFRRRLAVEPVTKGAIV
jgi:putative membrane protein